VLKAPESKVFRTSFPQPPDFSAKRSKWLAARLTPGELAKRRKASEAIRKRGGTACVHRIPGRARPNTERAQLDCLYMRLMETRDWKWDLRTEPTPMLENLARRQPQNCKGALAE
jgi:hypothetical protein